MFFFITRISEKRIYRRVVKKKELRFQNGEKLTDAQAQSV